MPNVIQCNFSIFNIEVSGKKLKFSAGRDTAFHKKLLYLFQILLKTVNHVTISRF